MVKTTSASSATESTQSAAWKSQGASPRYCASAPRPTFAATPRTSTAPRTATMTSPRSRPRSSSHQPAGPSPSACQMVFSAVCIWAKSRVEA